MARPILTIVGGPNGSGKSTLMDALAAPGEFVNADRTAREIDPIRPERAFFGAGRRVVSRLGALMDQRRDFAYETTLSSRQSVALMRTARTVGYEIGLVFVVLRDVELNIRRVAERVLAGGHDIPEPVIRRRYGGSLANLATAISLADAVVVFDNSALVGPTEILRLADSRIMRSALDPTVEVHRRIAASIGRSFGADKKGDRE